MVEEAISVCLTLFQNITPSTKHEVIGWSGLESVLTSNIIWIGKPNDL